MSLVIEDRARVGTETVQDPLQIDASTRLPPGFLPFEDFARQFSLGEASTEQLHPITQMLSQTMHRNVGEGLELLLKVDEKVIEGLAAFIPTICEKAPVLAGKLKNGGRIFLVGSGSSGRVAIDIAAKCRCAFPEAGSQIHGVIAGGDSAFVRAKEGFEDSEADGRRALEAYNLSSKDTVILISASGSASFNVGVGHLAADLGASVYYFYNSVKIPSRTEQLFSRAQNPATPFCVDIGPQAIGGSTRLQGATLAEAGLGALLVSALYLVKGEDSLSRAYPRELMAKMEEGVALIKRSFKNIERVILQEKGVFSDPRSNFRQLRDVTDQGYVTFIAAGDSIREILIDATETSPTFSTNPIRREGEGHKKRAEFRAYLVGEKENQKAWSSLLGREVTPADQRDTGTFLLGHQAEGENAYQKRPKGKGNLTIGVAKLEADQPLSKEMIQELSKVKQEGGEVTLLLLCRGQVSDEQRKALQSLEGSVFLLENIPHDAEGFTETILLKQILNLISNGTMVLMNKIHGNQMIDVRASNQKLIDRCMRLIKESWKAPLDDRELYFYVAHVSVLKKSYEEKGIYTPSIVKILLAMFYLKKNPNDFQEIVTFLHQQQEGLSWLEGRL